MLVHQCENCKQMTIWGCRNKYGQHFCNEECYLKYCEKHNYEAHPEELEYIKFIIIKEATNFTSLNLLLYLNKCILFKTLN